MMREAALGTTEILACLFWIVNLTVILRPFQSAVFLAMSSPTFFGDWNKYIMGENESIIVYKIAKNFLKSIKVEELENFQILKILTLLVQIFTRREKQILGINFHRWPK